MTITQATLKHLDDLSPLFDGYRIFYRQESNIIAVRQFLKERINNKDSVIYIAYSNEKAIGFTQLYPLLSSVSMEYMYVLNDLYIDSNYRSQGVGTLLMNKAKALCIKMKYKGLIIQTEVTNPAQHLYQREGFIKDTDLTFFWTNHKK